MNLEDEIVPAELCEMVGLSPAFETTSKISNDSGYFSSPTCSFQDNYDLKTFPEVKSKDENEENLNELSTQANEDSTNDIIKILSMIPKCTGCDHCIFDKDILKIEEGYWHTKCALCSECSIPLDAYAYIRDNMLYCQYHYYSCFGAKCATCCKDISLTEVVRKAENSVFHVDCFKCLLCDRELKTGDPFYLTKEKKVVCNQKHDNITDRDDIDQSDVKRPRSIITNKQQMALNSVYNQNPKPTRTVREELSRTTGLDMRVVQVWFQNRRAKDKRIITKQPSFDLWEEMDFE